MIYSAERNKVQYLIIFMTLLCVVGLLYCVWCDGYSKGELQYEQGVYDAMLYTKLHLKEQPYFMSYGFRHWLRKKNPERQSVEDMRKLELEWGGTEALINETGDEENVESVTDGPPSGACYELHIKCKNCGYEMAK